MDSVMTAQLDRKTFMDSRKVKLMAFAAEFFMVFLGASAFLEAHADGSCVKTRTRSGYTVSRDCVYQGRQESDSGRSVNIYLGGATPPVEESPAYPYAQLDGNSQCYAAPYQSQYQPTYQPQYQQSYQPTYQAQYQPSYQQPSRPVLQQVAPGVYVQRAPQYGQQSYQRSQQHPQYQGYGQGQEFSSPQIFQQLGQKSFNVQNAPLLLSPSALAQAVPVYLVQNTNYGQFQAAPVPAPAPVAQPAPVAPRAAVAAPPPPVIQAPQIIQPAALPQYQGVVSNNLTPAPVVIQQAPVVEQIEIAPNPEEDIIDETF